MFILEEELYFGKYTEDNIIQAALKWIKEELDFDEPLIEGAAEEFELWLEFETDAPLHSSEFMDLDCDFLFNKGKKLRFSNVQIVDWLNVLEKYL